MLAVPFPRVARDAVEAQETEALREVGVVGGDHAALAGGDGLDGMEAEDRRGAAAADRPPTIRRAERVRRVLDQCDAVPRGEGTERIQVDRLPREVDRHDRACAIRDGTFDRGRIQVERRRIDVREHRPRPTARTMFPSTPR